MMKIDRGPRWSSLAPPVALLFWLFLLIPAGPARADWEVMGTAYYRDRLVDPNGFTGEEPLEPIRFADVEVRDDTTGAILAEGPTGADGGFVIPVSDSLVRNVYVRVLSRSDQTPDLFLRVTTGSGPVYAIAGSVIVNHLPDQDLDTGALVAEIRQGGEAFNLYDMGVAGMDYLAFLMGSRPGPADALTIRWEVDRGQMASGASKKVIELRDAAGHDDSVILHEFGHYAVLNFSDSDTPGGSHSFADCHESPALAWDEGHATFFGSAVRRHFGMPRSHSYVATTGELGPGHLRLYADLETESEFECNGSTSEVSVFTGLWDVLDGPSDPDETPGIDDGPVDVLQLPDADHWETMTALPGHLYITAEDYWDAWIEPPVMNDHVPERISIFGLGVEIEYFEDPFEPNDTLATAAPVPGDGSPTHATFFKDPDGDGAGGDLFDLDWFSFPAVGGKAYRLETLNLWSSADTVLRLYDSTHAFLTINDDRAPGDLSSLIEWTAPSTGTYFLEVEHDGRALTPHGSYDIRVRLADTDGDGILDETDLCPFDPDPGQEDDDADGVGDACDDCPDDANAGQENADGDGAGDACDACPLDPADDADTDGLCGDVDNCPAVYNNGQEDADDDGLGDACDDDMDGDGAANADDCAPLDATAFAVPVEVTDLIVSDTEPTNIAFTIQAAGTGTCYPVQAGLVTRVLQTQSLQETFCLASCPAMIPLPDARSEPPVGDAWFYLAHAENACGTGTLGGPARDAAGAGNSCALGVVDQDMDGSPSDFDCDDGDPAIFPWSGESCDGMDNNCDGQVDEDCVP